MLHISFSLLFFASFFAPAICWPEGAPITTCTLMDPLHNRTGLGQPLAKSPHSVHASTTTYHRGQTIDVTIKSTEMNFTGIFLQARSQTINSDTAIGKWIIGDTMNEFQYLSCGNPLGAITQTYNYNKTFPVTFKWTAPVNKGYGDVIFYATILQSEKWYFTKIPSSRLTYDATTDPPKCGGTAGSLSIILLCLCVASVKMIANL